MTTNPKPEALISTPAEAAQCAPCMGEYLYRLDRFGPLEGDPTPTCSRFEGETISFAHCDVCGSTDLLDTRSPFEVLVEAMANVEKAADDYRPHTFALLTPETQAQAIAQSRLSRMDVVDRVRSIASQADAGHCSDCTSWAVKAAVAGVRF